MVEASIALAEMIDSLRLSESCMVVVRTLSRVFCPAVCSTRLRLHGMHELITTVDLRLILFRPT